MITDREALVLVHTSQNGRYVTDDPFVIEMGKRGLLRDHGPWELAGGASFLTMTPKSRDLLIEWRAAQPKSKNRRISREFQKWQDFCEAFKRITFSEFHKEVWPKYKFK
jgi:hypothetical protein